MSRTLRESVALGAIGAVYERLLETDGESLQVWCDGETPAEWRGPEVKEACCEAYQGPRPGMQGRIPDELWNRKEMLR